MRTSGMQLTPELWLVSASRFLPACSREPLLTSSPALPPSFLARRDDDGRHRLVRPPFLLVVMRVGQVTDSLAPSSYDAMDEA